jgi:glucose-1-phosphate adenylyltransferase
VDDSGRIVEFREKPADAVAREGMEVATELLEKSGCDQDRPFLASMGIYLFKKKVLIECLENDLGDFGRDILPAEVDRRRVQAHIFGGYWRDIGTIRAFYDAHMDMVRPDPPFDFYDSDWPFYTHPRYLPGARLDNVRFTRSILAEGSRISDSTVEDSIVGVRTILRRATIRRSLVMGADYYAPGDGDGVPPVGIGPGSVIENAIVDKNARIGRDVKVINQDRVQEANGTGWVIREGVVMIAKDAVIPDGTKI